MSKTEHNENLSATPGTKTTPVILDKPYEPEPGDPMYDGEDELQTVVKANRRRSPGISERSKRVLLWKLFKRRELTKQNKGLTRTQIDDEVEKAFKAFREQPDFDDAIRIFGETAPVSRSIRPSDTIADVEMAAMRRLPWTRGLDLILGLKKNKRGYAARKALVIAIFFQMAFGRERVEIASTYVTLAEESRPLRSWAHDYPEPTKRPTAYEALRNTFTRQGEAGVVLQLNVAMLKELSEIKDAGIAYPRQRGRKKGERILIGEIGIVDGTQIGAWVPQETVKRDDLELKAILHGHGRDKAAFVRHQDEKGNTTKKNFGYSVVTIVDMASTLPFGTVFMPATGNEREALLILVRAIFEAWPECPMGAIVGDSLYNRSKATSHELVFKWGIQPIFPAARNDFGKDAPHADTDGVPTCRCKEADGRPTLMKLIEADGFYTAERRAREGVPRGVEAGLDARLCWECKEGKVGCGEKAYTRPRKDPRLYTYFPRQGFHARATERRVLLWRRNAVESVFATLKNLGLGRDKFECPRWAKDLAMEWLVAVGMFGIVARRMIHETGLYDEVLAEARQLDLLTPATIENPSPGPDKLAVKKFREARDTKLDPPILPPGFEHLLEESA